MPPAYEPTCGNCPCGRSHIYNNAPMIECRINAPIPSGAILRGIWPFVQKNDWCMQHPRSAKRLEDPPPRGN